MHPQPTERTGRSRGAGAARDGYCHLAPPPSGQPRRRPSLVGRLATAAALTATTLTLAACGDDGTQRPPTYTQAPGSDPDRTPHGGPDVPSGEQPVVSTVADGLETPWGLDFLPDGDAVVTERDTRRLLRVGADGEVTVLGTVEEAEPVGEAGLLGVAVSPEFTTDSSIFVYLTTASDNRVLRYTLDGDDLSAPEVVISSIPFHENHDGGRIAFGPDGHLYVATGDARQEWLAQDPGSPGGKILRITPDGDPAPGNPEPGSPVWSMGHRNVQGLAWDDEDRLWASEFGSQEWDELNLVEPGGNFGWPEVEGKGGGDGFVDPQLVWSTDEASPSGLAYADGHLWMATLRGNRLWRISVADGRASDPVAFFEGRFGRLRTVVRAPDGSLWVTTSNRDGRGDPGPDDDQILRVKP